MDRCASTCGAIEMYGAMHSYLLIFLQVLAEVSTRRPKPPARRGASAALHSGGEEWEARSSDSRSMRRACLRSTRCLSALVRL